MICKNELQEGMGKLEQPVLPLIGMVQFLFLTGDFATVDEVICQMPPDIVTGFATYTDPVALLQPYADLLQPLVTLKAGQVPPQTVVDLDHTRVDALTATTAMVAQAVLSRELEQINSALCAPCGCTLCCIGPDTAMKQCFFEIPLQPDEVDRFSSLLCIDTPISRSTRSNDEPVLQVQQTDFYQQPDPLLLHWQTGWSMVLPTGSRCPHLEKEGRCRIYPDRPQVCRRPQIFPYVVEPIERKGQQLYRLRNALLAVIDCPYVRLMQEEISAYAAACELEMVFRQNKG